MKQPLMNRNLTLRMLEYFRQPRPVLGLSNALDADPEEVKQLLYSLRASGVLADVRGHKRSLVCQLDPQAAKQAADLLYAIAEEP